MNRKTEKSSVFFSFVLLIGFFLHTQYAYTAVLPNADGIIFVNANAATDKTGSSWNNACLSLARALKEAETYNATSPAVPITQIWVAQGSYKPEYPADGYSINTRDNAFVLPDEIKLYGGFVPSMATDSHYTGINDKDDPLKREWADNKTYLDGDLAGNDSDVLNEHRFNDNAYHVLISSGNASTAGLNGFTVINGHAKGTPVAYIHVNGEQIFKSSGGGMYCVNSTPVLEYIVFKDNFALENGGGMYLLCNDNIIFKHLSFIDNIASINEKLNNTYYVGRGGGICINPTSAPSGKSVTFSACTFENNLAQGTDLSTSEPKGRGGAIGIRNYEDADGFNLILNEHEGIATQFINNTATFAGGAIYLADVNLIATNILFDNNTAGQQEANQPKERYGGAIYMITTNTEKEAVINGCLFTNNQVIGKAGHNDMLNGRGGAIAVQAPIGKTIRMTFGKNGSTPTIFRNNKADCHGGAVYLYNTICEATETLFEYNTTHIRTSYSHGGAICMETDEITNNSSFADCIFRNNRADKPGSAGGAIYAHRKNSGVFTLNFSQTGSNTENAFSNNYADSYGGAIFVVNTNIVANNITFYRNSTSIISGLNAYGGAVYGGHESPNTATTSSTFSNCYFKENLSVYGGGVHFEGSGVPLEVNFISDNKEQEVFANNIAINSGGAISTDNVSMTVIKGKFTKNTARRGGVLYGHGSKQIFNDCTFTNNQTEGTSDGGGALYIYNSLLEAVPNVELTNCLFKENTTDADHGKGGAVFMNNATASIKQVLFENNLSTYGGALYGEEVGINFTETDFKNNSATKNNEGCGGAMYLKMNVMGQDHNAKELQKPSTKAIDDSKVVMREIRYIQGDIIGNKANNSGGAIYSELAGIIMEKVNFENDSALCIDPTSKDGGLGGAMYNVDSRINIVDTTRFVSNYAGRMGGAVANVYKELDPNLLKLSSFDCTNSLFENNHAQLGGGALYNEYVKNKVVDLTSIKIHYCRFRNNKAFYDQPISMLTDDLLEVKGGAILNRQSGMTMTWSNFVGNEAKVADNIITQHPERISPTGASVIHNDTTSAYIKSIRVQDNSGYNAAIINSCSDNLKVINVLATGNTTAYIPGADYTRTGSSMAAGILDYQSNARYVNNTIAHNTISGNNIPENMQIGSGLLTKGTNHFGITSIINAIIYYNRINSSAENNFFNAEAENRIIYSDVEELDLHTYDLGNKNGLPRFTDIQHGCGSTINNTYRLTPYSCAIRKGYIGSYQAGGPFEDVIYDITGETGRHDEHGVDMGVYQNDAINQWIGAYGLGKVKTNPEPDDHLWGIKENWTLATIPLETEDIIFHEDAIDLYVDNLNRETIQTIEIRVTPSVINDTDADVVVLKNSGLKLTGDNPVNFSHKDAYLVINAEDGTAGSTNGTLIVNEGQDITALVNLYTKAKSTDLSSTNVMKWQYFGIPVNSFAAKDMHGAYIRRYGDTEKITVGNTDHYKYWYNLDNTSMLYPTDGYEISVNSTHSGKFLFWGNLLTSDVPVTVTWGDDVEAPDRPFKGQRVISNPFTAALSIDGIDFGADDTFEKAAYLFNSGSSEQWEEQGGVIIDDQQSGEGQYTALVPGLGGKIPSMQGFVVGLNPSGAYPQGTLTLKYSGIETTNAVMRTKQSDTGRLHSRITLSNNDRIKDRTWLYTNEQATRKFDNGYDGRKIFGSPHLAQLFFPEEDGNYQVNCLPDIDNTYLSFKAEKDIEEYTLTFNHQNNEEYQNILLIDLVTGAAQDITENGATYTFTGTNSNKAEKRFLIKTQREDNSDETNTTENLEVYQTDNTILLRSTFGDECTIGLFDVSGAMIYTQELQPNIYSAISESLFTPGVYLVKQINGKNGNAGKKIIIK